MEMVPSPSKGRILVADDEFHICRIIEMKLSQMGYNVTLCYDGQDALDRLQKEGPFDLVLLDIMMPYLTGFDVLEAMRADSALCHITAFILTAKGHETDRARALELGAQEFFTKPFSPKKLGDRVDEFFAAASAPTA